MSDYTKADFLMFEAFETNSPLLAVKAIQAGFDVNDFYGDDVSMFFVTSMMEDSLMLETFLQNGADIRMTNRNGETIMDYCIIGGNVDNFNILIREGFNFSHEDGLKYLKEATIRNHSAIIERLNQLGITNDH